MSEGLEITPEDIAASEKFFKREAQFVAGAAEAQMLPPGDLTEIAFWGRSNVGKSSLINGLTFRKNLARSSNTPGRTQQINFFDLGGQVALVDLPGYGYAKASKEDVYNWNMLIETYLQGRDALARVFLLVDARHGIKEVDEECMALLDSLRVPYVIVLTKIDKLKKGEVEDLTKETQKRLGKFKNAFPQVYAASAEKGWGMDVLRAVVAMSTRI